MKLLKSSRKLIVLWCAALAVMLLYFGCATAPDTPGTENDNGQPADNTNDNSDNGSGPELSPEEVEAAIAGASNYQEWSAAVSSRTGDYEPDELVHTSNLIEQAYRTGEIDEEEYYLTRITAIFTPDELRSQYQGAPDSEVEPTCLLHAIQARFDGFSAATQDRLRPYLLSFDDPESYWYDPDLPTAEELIASSPSAVRPVPNMDRPTPLGNRFIVTGPDGTEDEQNVVRAALEHAYEEYTDLGFAEPTDWIPVHLQEHLDYRGVAWMAELLDHDRCHIIVQMDEDVHFLQGVAAHELFHCFQNYMGEEPDNFNSDWVRESTATWAEEFAFPDNNTEHEFEDEAFATFSEHFFDTRNTREYASYLFWFFVYHRDGKTGQAVKLLLDDIFEVGEDDALMNWREFYYEFKEYALWNLNTDPFDFYEDNDDEPVLPPTNGSIVYEQIREGDSHYEGLDLYPGAIAYYVYSIGQNVNKLVIDVEDIQKTADNYNGIQMVWEDGSEVHYEDLSFRDERVFCRSREGENVDLITLIISNGQMASSASEGRLDGNLRIDARGRCEEGWRGFVECRSRSSGIGQGNPTDIFQIGTYSSQTWSRVESKLVYDERDDRFFSVEDTASKVRYYRWYWPNENWDDFTGGVLWEKKIRNEQGSTTIVREVPADCPPSCSGLPRAIISEVDEEGYSTYILRERSITGVGTYEATHYALDVPGTLGQMQGHVPDLWVDEQEGAFGLTCPPENLELVLSSDGLMLSGSYESESLTVYAQYSYE